MSDTVSEDDIYRLVGLALTNWAEVESELGTLFVISIGATNKRAAYRSFFALHGFDSKLRVVNEAATGATYRMPELKTRWKSIHNRLDKHKDRRNDVAHGVVELGNENVILRSSPGPHMYGGVNRSKKSNITSIFDIKRLDDLAKSFAEDATQIMYFWSDLQDALTLKAQHAADRETTRRNRTGPSPNR